VAAPAADPAHLVVPHRRRKKNGLTAWEEKKWGKRNEDREIEGGREENIFFSSAGKKK
jgi:hypothetical protein